MKDLEHEKPSINRLRTAKRKAVTVAQEEVVRTKSFQPGSIPLIVCPALEGVSLHAWATRNREFIAAQLLEHRAILFRDFKIRTVEDFEQFVKLTSHSGLLEYRDRSTPRTSMGNKVYTSTVYPESQRINLHNEGTYWLTCALKIYFCCLTASKSGGETPIADVRRVYERIDPKIRELFIEKKMMFVRNYNDGFGLSWQEVFQTTDKNEVEQYCNENCIEFEWKSNDRLKTYQVRPAVRKHPYTGEMVWFNHLAFFHVTTLEPTMREMLLAEFGEEGLPFNTYYGDGTPIEPYIIEHIREGYEQEKVVFPWQEGDILMLDNMSIAHGREPFTGDRKVVVAMTEPFTDNTIATVGEGWQVAE